MQVKKGQRLVAASNIWVARKRDLPPCTLARRIPSDNIRVKVRQAFKTLITGIHIS